MGTTMNLQEQSDLVLDFAQVLHANGQSTDNMLAATGKLSNSLGLRATIIPSWDELQLEATEGTSRLFSVVAASPTGVHMERVSSTIKTIDEVVAGRMTPSDALQMIGAIAHAPPAPTWLFALAAGAGAAALSVIFGVQHISSVVLIAISAAGGAILRRMLARYSANPVLQPFCAALLAGIIGALAVRYQLSSSLRLIAVCPCMILVPGPHMLNGMMDLIVGRISLGACRLVYACFTILAICCGLLLGLSLFGVSLPPGAPGRAVPMVLDITAAAVAVGAFSVFFSMPLRILALPVATGALAHALRWWTLELGGGVAMGAFTACLFVGLVLTPISHRRHLPFAAIGFASVVSMMPGVFLFRMASGLQQLANSSNTTLNLLASTTADGMTAFNIILAMTFGVVVPKIVIDSVKHRVPRSKPLENRKDLNVDRSKSAAPRGQPVKSRF